jgi:hypothetical protein
MLLVLLQQLRLCVDQSLLQQSLHINALGEQALQAE